MKSRGSNVTRLRRKNGYPLSERTEKTIFLKLFRDLAPLTGILFIIPGKTRAVTCILGLQVQGRKGEFSSEFFVKPRQGNIGSTSPGSFGDTNHAGFSTQKSGRLSLKRKTSRFFENSSKVSDRRYSVRSEAFLPDRHEQAPRGFRRKLPQ